MAFEHSAAVVRVGDINLDQARHLLSLFLLKLQLVDDEHPIPGSFWGECEAGIIGSTVYVRRDTPVHSLLHEACHLIVLPLERRAQVHTDATDSVAEEDASCYLQLLLANSINGFGFARACADMDLWGYTFRLGSAQAWFENDAEDAQQFLTECGILPLSLPETLQHVREA